jgi:hypothetical protein
MKDNRSFDDMINDLKTAPQVKMLLGLLSSFVAGSIKSFLGDSFKMGIKEDTEGNVDIIIKIDKSVIKKLKTDKSEVKQ